MSPPLAPGDVGETVPVTVIGGYLGAGKTTLVNRLLAGRHGRRLAVLVNDFGEINVDAELMLAHDGETLTLANGCVCCSIAGALGDALEQVLSREPAPENIVIEASGVADPAKVARYTGDWPGGRLDAVVVLADAETVRARARDKFVGALVQHQLRAADLVVLNKIDLVAAEERAHLRAWLAELAPAVRIEETSQAALPPELLLDCTDLQARDREIAPNPMHESNYDSHARQFASASIVETAPFDRGRFEATVRRWPDAIWRAKGLVHFADDPGRTYLLQRVGQRVHIESFGLGLAEQPESRLVLLGPGASDAIDHARQSLRDALA